jgi:hypothetical protein
VTDLVRVRACSSANADLTNCRGFPANGICLPPRLAVEGYYKSSRSPLKNGSLGSTQMPLWAIRFE